MLLRLNVNGVWREADAWPGASLLAVLRDDMGLWGTKNACEQGECGSCSVWLDDDLVCACLVLAAQADGRRVVTVEGLAGEGPAEGATEGTVRGAAADQPDAERVLHPVQRAFLDAGAVQCGFCTPGLVVAVTDLLRRDPDPSDEAIREALSGNLCRCTGYQKIVDAVHLAAARTEGAGA